MSVWDINWIHPDLKQRIENFALCGALESRLNECRHAITDDVACGDIGGSYDDPRQETVEDVLKKPVKTCNAETQTQSNPESEALYPELDSDFEVSVNFANQVSSRTPACSMNVPLQNRDLESTIGSIAPETNPNEYVPRSNRPKYNIAPPKASTPKNGKRDSFFPSKNAITSDESSDFGSDDEIMLSPTFTVDGKHLRTKRTESTFVSGESALCDHTSKQSIKAQRNPKRIGG